MFLHVENKELLWKTLQRSPYLVDFSNKFAGYREVWFKGIMETFYTQWISQNNRVPTNARELLEINKSALHFIIADIKRLLGYSVSSQHSVQVPLQSFSFDAAASNLPKISDLLPSFTSYAKSVNPIISSIIFSFVFDC